MRACQICGETDRRLLYADYARKKFNLYECDACGHQYLDGRHLSQAWFDHYYATEYRTTDAPYSFDRYNSLANYAALQSDDILDIGGKNGELHEHFAKLPVKYKAIGVGDKLERHECAILSHTLEHVYDVGTLMTQISRVSEIIIIEVPIHTYYRDDPREYDCHFQHINKFRPQDLISLLQAFQYSVFEFCKLPNYLEFECWRIAGKL